MTRRGGSGGTRGQSLVEFALILPLMLTFVGAAVDFARAYQVWLTMQSATRNAAEYVATRSGSATAAIDDATRVVCLETQDIVGYETLGGLDDCISPTVTVTSFSLSTTAPGATATAPLADVTIEASMPFDMLFPYPFLNDGSWTITSRQTYRILQNR